MSNQPRYTAEFREMACKLAESSKNRSAVARELAMPVDKLRNWVTTYRSRLRKEHKMNEAAILQAKLDESNRRIAELEEEVDILKKATAYFAKGQQ
jgi:transposase